MRDPMSEAETADVQARVAPLLGDYDATIAMLWRAKPVEQLLVVLALSTALSRRGIPWRNTPFDDIRHEAWALWCRDDEGMRGLHERSIYTVAETALRAGRSA